jgi:cytoskeletal protein CcmA (bactofilin family)
MFERKDPVFRKSELETNDSPRTTLSESRMDSKSVFIGQSIFIKGELTGNEDMTIEGRVDGNIQLKDHNVTIGSSGKIEAEIFAKNITIMGEVQGNVTAESRVEIKKTGKLNGNIVAPRVSIEDGARFRGSIDMEGASELRKSGSRGKESGDKESTGTLPMDNLKEKATAS